MFLFHHLQSSKPRGRTQWFSSKITAMTTKSTPAAPTTRTTLCLGELLQITLVTVRLVGIDNSVTVAQGGAIRPKNCRQVIFWAKKVGFSDFTCSTGAAKSWLLGFQKSSDPWPFIGAWGITCSTGAASKSE